MQAPECTRELLGSIIHGNGKLPEIKKWFLKNQTIRINCGLITANTKSQQKYYQQGKPHKPCRMKKQLKNIHKVYINKKTQNH